jgi:hypothetical protein
MAGWHIDGLSDHRHTRTEVRKDEPLVRWGAKPRASIEGRSVVEDVSNPRQDIERFLAMGGGSFDALLDMLGEEQAPETLPIERASQTLGSPAWLPRGYRLEYGPDALILRRADGPLVAAFSVQGATGEAIVRAAEEDYRGWPAYFGPEEYAYSVRRLVETRAGHSWERFLRTERRMLEARKNGQLAKALAWRLPGESQKELDRMVSEDRRRAKERLVELKSEEGESSCKQVEELAPEERMDRIRAELARIEWLLERHRRRNAILQSGFFEQRQSRKSIG